MNTSFETTDIFRGAFFMCIGGDLESIRFRTKQIATFTFIGEDLQQQDRDYINGDALVNPVQFREALNHLRDILFTRLRQGRYENDRTNQNRHHQNRHRP